MEKEKNKKFLISSQQGELDAVPLYVNLAKKFEKNPEVWGACFFRCVVAYACCSLYFVSIEDTTFYCVYRISAIDKNAVYMLT